MGMLAERGGRLQGGGGGRQYIQNQKRDVFFFSVFFYLTTRPTVAMNSWQTRKEMRSSLCLIMDSLEIASK
jgi:hypothetical protein